MSDVKRYALNISRPPYGLEPVRAGKLVMYVDHAAALSAAYAERDALRAEVERLNQVLRSIHIRAQAYAFEEMGMPGESPKVLEWIARKALEAGACAPTTGSTPEA